MPARKRRALWSPAALRDVRDIGEYLAANASFRTAERIFRKFEAMTVRLTERPLQAPSRSDLCAGLRGALVAPYIVFYRPDAHGIEIVRVLHQSRDLTPALDEPMPGLSNTSETEP